MTKHTQGPWIIDEDTGMNDGGTIKDTDGRGIAMDIYGRTADEANANARLIAAAPELLEACQARLEADEVFEQGTSEWHQSVNCADSMMQAAIAKATRQ